MCLEGGLLAAFVAYGQACVTLGPFIYSESVPSTSTMLMVFVEDNYHDIAGNSVYFKSKYFS